MKTSAKTFNRWQLRHTADDTWKVEDRHTKRVVLEGESYGVASRVCERMNGQPNGCGYGEPEEVADQIKQNVMKGE